MFLIDFATKSTLKLVIPLVVVVRKLDLLYNFCCLNMFSSFSFLSELEVGKLLSSYIPILLSSHCLCFAYCHINASRLLSYQNQHPWK